MLTIPDVDLPAWIERDLGYVISKGGRRWWRCPFHDDGNPSLTVTPDGRRWKCFGCGAGGDAVDWVRRRCNVDFKGAVELLGGGLPQSRPSAPATPNKPLAKPLKPDPAEWRRKAGSIVEAAEQRLWTPQGAKALAWLMARGLTEATIREARLGYHDRDGKIDGVFVARGIAIPWFAGGGLRFVQIRRPAGAPKYMAIAHGSRGGWYPAPPRPGRPVVICEGEFDALLAQQEAGDLIDGVTLGGAADDLDADAATAVACCPVVLVATDADPAGEAAASRWLKLTARARRIRPPHGKDITDAYLAGADLRAWIGGHLPHLPQDAGRGEDRDLAYVDPPAPCPKCGSLVVWWDLAGGVHCLACDPPTTSRRLMDLAERIRRRPARPAAQTDSDSGTFQRKRKKYKKHPRENLKNLPKTIADPNPCPHHLDPATWAESPDPGRAGWVRTVCRRCGKFLGYHPGKRR